jgi:DNA-directed RNA polymerase II subunit RPB1
MSVIDRFPHSTAELRRVKAVQFGVLSPDEIVRAPPAPISWRGARNDSLGLPPRARRVPDLS